MKKVAFAVLSVLCTVILTRQSWGEEEQDYIEKLEGRLMALEQKLYTSDSMTKRTIPEGLKGDAAMMADLEIRMQQLEEESQKVYGAVEELGHLVRDFAKRTDMMTKDFDMRLQDIENGASSMQKNTESLKKDVQKAATKTPLQASEKTPVKAIKSEKKVNTVSQNVDIPKDMDPDSIYNKAYNFLMATAYSDAEKWMKGFIERYPSHELADNAHYWLGEIYLVQGNVQKAVVSFTTGLSQFPTGVKAPANLLKMGIAFKRLGKKDFAKSSWKKLQADYPSSPEAKKAQKELDKLALDN